MAAHNHPDSLRRKAMSGPWDSNNPMRPGKTAEDKRIGAWSPKGVKARLRQERYENS